MTGTADAAAPALRLEVYTSPARAIRGPGERTFSPVTSTLIAGEREAVLVDSGFYREDVDALGDMIAASGKALTTIFVTHGHSDHYYGSARLADRFPDVRVVAAAGVVGYISDHLEADVRQTAMLFGEEAFVAPTLLPSPLTRDTILLEGHELRVIEVGQGDIAPSTVLHVPELDAVITGDVTYNGIHQMLGLGGPTEWDRWVQSVNTIETLTPKTVVSGHKRPGWSDDEPARILGDTRSYIRDFAAAAAVATSPAQLIQVITSMYPDHGNVTTLHFSAHAAMKVRSTASTE